MKTIIRFLETRFPSRTQQALARANKAAWRKSIARLA